MNKPKKWPYLSQQLLGPRELLRCQACAVTFERPDLIRWRECADDDQPTSVAVILCRPCSTRLIDPHPRLYIETHWGEAFPGAMACCLECDHRDGLRCRNALLKSNGGPGLAIVTHATHLGIVCSRSAKAGSRCRPYAEYSGPPDCHGQTYLGQPVGDRGQRYVIKTLWAGEERIAAYAADEPQKLVDALSQHPEVSKAWFEDRQSETSVVPQIETQL